MNVKNFCVIVLKKLLKYDEKQDVKNVAVEEYVEVNIFVRVR